MAEPYSYDNPAPGRTALSYLYEDDLVKMIASSQIAFEALAEMRPYGVGLQKIVDDAKAKVAGHVRYLRGEIDRIRNLEARDG